MNLTPKAGLLLPAIRIFLVPAILLTNQPSFAQSTRQIDSLKLVINSSATEDARAAAYEQLAYAMLGVGADSVLHYSLKSEQLYSSIKNDTSLFNMYSELALRSLENGQTTIAYRFLNKGLQLSRKGKVNQTRVWFLFDHFYDYHSDKGSYDSSLFYGQKMLTASKDTSDMVNALKSMGLAFNQLGRPVQALEVYLQALKLLEDQPASRLKGSVYNNLGILYEDDGNLKKAEEYYLDALRLFKESKIDRSVFNTQNNLGILYSMQDRHEESLKILFEAEALLPALMNELQVAICNLNIGNTLAHMDRAAESIPRFEKAMVIFNKQGDKYGIALCHRQLGEAFYYVGRNAEAEQHEFESLKGSKKYGYTALVEDSYNDLSRIYEARKDYKNAYFYFKLNRHLKDSLNDKEKQSKLGLLEKEFEIATQEKETQRLEQQNEIQQAQAVADRRARIALGVGLGLFILAAGVAGVAWLRSRQKNIILAEQKAKIEDQAEQLREAARNKSRFFANVSHELRTPITLLNGMLELMQENGSDQNTDEKLKIAVGNSRRLQNLVDEVLDLSRLEVGKADLKTRRLPILPLVNRIVLAFESLLTRKNIKLSLTSSNLEGIMMNVDEDKFEKILNNLLYNAIKFNKDNGWIRVACSLNADGRHILIEVTDSGIGIPEADLPKIFERFYQSSSGDSKNAQGIGIGLSLVKEFTELHEGKVSVMSVVGEQTTFRLSFPVALEIIEAEVELNESISIKPVSFAEFKEKPVVLIVEDNDEMRFYVRQILGDDVVLHDASNGVEALAWLANNKAHLIISDVMMPEMNGYELMERLKADDVLKGIPVFMLTARASEEDTLSGLSLGIDDYVTKPFNARELKVRIHNLLKNQEIRSQWKSKPVEEDEQLPVSTEDKTFINAVEAFVEARASDSSLSIGDVADHLAMSERQLFRKSGATTGMSPAQLIKEIRLRIAYRMLVRKEVTKVTALASSVGFENSSYFSRQFQERYGKKPVEFL
jgi:signal transduction histidine kinase/DNA-binding response OmpR family regulator